MFTVATNMAISRLGLQHVHSGCRVHAPCMVKHRTLRQAPGKPALALARHAAASVLSRVQGLPAAPMQSGQEGGPSMRQIPWTHSANSYAGKYYCKSSRDGVRHRPDPHRQLPGLGPTRQGTPQRRLTGLGRPGRIQGIDRQAVSSYPLQESPPSGPKARPPGAGSSELSEGGAAPWECQTEETRLRVVVQISDSLATHPDASYTCSTRDCLGHRPVRY